MKLWRFTLKNVLRNKRRTILTILSLSVSIFIVLTLLSVLHGFEADDSGQSHLRLIVRHKVSLTNLLPEAYWDKIKQVPHVEAVTPWSWFGGVYKDANWENQFARFAVDPDQYMAITKHDRNLPADQAQAWKADRRGFIAGKSLADKQHWKLGDVIVIKGDIYPVDVELTLDGIFTATPVEEEDVAFFHHMYLEELTGRQGRSGTYWVKVDAAENLTTVAKSIDTMFQNSDHETLAETEKQFMADFVSMIGNVKGFLKVLSLVVAFAILMVAANTMAMAVRERTTEVSVLKALGFTPRLILGTILGESITIAILAWGVACVLNILMFNMTGSKLPGLWTPMALTVNTAAIGAGIALIIGLVSGAIPGVVAARLPVVDGLRKVA